MFGVSTATEYFFEIVIDIIPDLYNLHFYTKPRVEKSWYLIEISFLVTLDV